MKTICALMLAICGLMIGIARGDEPKGYRITLSDGRIGTAQLDAGEYKMLVHRDEPKVQLMEIRTGNVIDVAAKVETVDSKFERTEVHSQKVDGENQITEIRIGGTKVRIDFRITS